jgi:hypothetical protein
MEIFAILPVLILIIVSFVWTATRSEDIIHQWASSNDYTLLEAKQAYLSKGPFFWTTSKGQTVYRITVQDRYGNVLHGWARCGSWFAGLFSNSIEVRWDDQ